MNCEFCVSDNIEVKTAPEVCDAYEGQYSYQTINYCKNCHKYFYAYSGPSPELYEMWAKEVPQGVVNHLQPPTPES
jgi:hypothetical protein